MEMEISIEFIQEIAMHMYHNLLQIGQSSQNQLSVQFPMNEFVEVDIDNSLYPLFEGRIMRNSHEDGTYSLILEIKRDDRVWIQSITM